jgi:hypothetical protein
MAKAVEIGPYFPDFSLNRTTIRLKTEKICPRFSTFSLRSLLPRRLLRTARQLDSVAANRITGNDVFLAVYRGIQQLTKKR